MNTHIFGHDATGERLIESEHGKKSNSLPVKTIFIVLGALFLIALIKFVAYQPILSVVKDQSSSVDYYSKKNDTSGLFRVKLKKLSSQYRDNKTPSRCILQACHEDTLDIKIHDFLDMQYYGEGEVGSQRQKVRLVYDSGSTNLWVTSVDCSPANCKSHLLYDRKKSKTSKQLGKPISILYGSGLVSGELVCDDVYINGRIMNNVTFGDMNNVSGLGVAYLRGHYDGIFGLGRPSVAVDNVEPPIMTMKNQGIVNQAVFAFALEKIPSDKGELTIGGVDSTMYQGTINWNPVATEYYWDLHVAALYVEETQVVNETHHLNCVLDSGTSLVLLPPSVIYSIRASTNTVVVNVNGFLFVDCRQRAMLPNIFIVIGDRKYPLSQEDYVHEEQKGGDHVCIILMAEAEICILGDVFMRRYYSIFDYENSRVGLAYLSMHSSV